MSEMNLEVFNTHIEVFPYKKGDYKIIEELYTLTNKFTQERVPCGYMIDNGILYLPRGTSISMLQNILKCKPNYLNEVDPIKKMSRKYTSLYDPRNKIQEESIDFLRTETCPQLGLNLSTGLGKTFCVAYTSTLISEKTIIITPNESLKNQWIKTYHEMFDYRASDLMNIAGSQIMNAIVEGTVDPANVYFVNHSTLRNYLLNNNGFMLHRFFKKINVGIKVYDESHMEFGNILLMDYFSNTARTWYLTATFDRSDKTESECFKRAFNNVLTYGEIESKEVVKKHVVYHVVNVNSRISPKDKSKVIGYKGMSSISYGQYAFDVDKNETAYMAIKMIVEKIKSSDGKILIFVPLIAAADSVVVKLKDDFPDKTIGAYHSKISKSDKESVEKMDIIVSTIKSTGTGKDIPGLRSVICAEPIASKVIAEQMIGRLRPYSEDKSTYFFDIVDICIPPINWWFRSRFKKIETLVKEVVYLNLDE